MIERGVGVHSSLSLPTPLLWLALFGHFAAAMTGERERGGWTDCYFLFFSLRERSDLRSERQPRPERRGVVGILYFATLM